jgi:hypothetical protein
MLRFLKVSQRPRKVSPRQAGLIGAVVVAPILAMVWYGAALILAFYAGATFGGYGEAARGPTAKWYVPVVCAAPDRPSDQRGIWGFLT